MTDVEQALEPSEPEMRRLISEASDRVVRHVATLASQPASWEGASRPLARSVDEPLPESGSSFAELLSLLFDRYVPASYNTAGPGYMAYIPGGGIFHSAIADFMADAFNRYVGVWQAAPALAQIEVTVGRWFCDLAGYPRSAVGILTSGGSMANLVAVVTARRVRLPTDFLRGTIYVSDQVHHSITKAATLAGFPEDAVRVVPSDGDFRIDCRQLRETVRNDRAHGRTPFMVVGSAGTTNTGAVDSLDELAAIAAEEGLWFHVDAAYGGFFLLTERGRSAFRGIERSDSTTLDPHKGLFLPYGTGSVLVREGAHLRHAHAVSGSYMPPMPDDPEAIDLSQNSPELSRGFRGLRVWLPLKLLGTDPFRRSLDEKLDLARWAAEQIVGIPSIELVAAPQLSVLAFRYAPAGTDSERLNIVNRRLLKLINERQRVFLSGTTLAGRFVLRVCVLSFRTHFDRVHAFVDDLKSSLANLLDD